MRHQKGICTGSPARAADPTGSRAWAPLFSSHDSDRPGEIIVGADADGRLRPPPQLVGTGTNAIRVIGTGMAPRYWPGELVFCTPDRSILGEDQLETCRRYAAAKGWRVVGIYADAALSGSVSQRPEFERLQRDSECGAPQPPTKELWEITADEDLRIVDDALWNSVKARQAQVRTEMARNENGQALNGRIAPSTSSRP